MVDIDYLRTLMMLHCGRAPWRYDGLTWYVRDKGSEDRPSPRHEVENHRAAKEYDGCYFWPTEEQLLVDYCKFYKLGPYTPGGNHERRNEPATAD